MSRGHPPAVQPVAAACMALRNQAFLMHALASIHLLHGCLQAVVVAVTYSVCHGWSLVVFGEAVAEACAAASWSLDLSERMRLLYSASPTWPL